jgi:Domain of Unknown Function (DUF1259)
MKQAISRRRLIGAAVALGATGVLPGEGRAEGGRTPLLSSDERAAIDQALGKKGALIEEQAVYTVPLPRNDLKVTIRGEPVPIPFGFGGWVAFKKTRNGKGTVMMSDTVLLQDEVNPVISAAHANGIEITAIHNHFFFEEPRLFYMHVHAMGEPGELARRYSQAIQPSKLHPANQPPAGPPPAKTGAELFDTARLAQIAGHEGQVNGPTYKITVGRPDLTVMAMGAEITAAIGLNSWAAFAGATDQAHIAGDIAMLEPEVNPVIAALRRNDLSVVALHHHMLGEEPRILFLHYYGTGPAETLARGFRTALDELGKHGRSMRMMRMGRREHY